MWDKLLIFILSSTTLKIMFLGRHRQYVIIKRPTWVLCPVNNLKMKAPRCSVGDPVKWLIIILSILSPTTAKCTSRWREPINSCQKCTFMGLVVLLHLVTPEKKLGGRLSPRRWRDANPYWQMCSWRHSRMTSRGIFKQPTSLTWSVTSRLELKLLKPWHVMRFQDLSRDFTLLSN